VQKGCDGRSGINLRLAGCELADGSIFQTVCLWEQRRESRDSDVLSEKVANGTMGVGVGIPDISFGGELSLLEIFGGKSVRRIRTMEIMKTFGVITSQSLYKTSMSRFSNASSAFSKTGEALTRAAPAMNLNKGVNLIFKDYLKTQVQ
jgi:hypothetical protein